MTRETSNSLMAGKSALITGASAGIGAAAARVFCREGASVTLVARREPQLASLTQELRAAGHQAQYVVADVSRTEDVARAVGEEAGGPQHPPAHLHHQHAHPDPPPHPPSH
ncbi:SDR family NAD(P)-dependent oxidoreductase, partial [Streptomyces sp. NPDC057705]|uniref:SDR family NAD(P)-dependent oxidoreductase n=1 Tax=Streptomyces sp. NPDC057705 TaxID=3346222 RepID=UPI0036C37975